MILLCICQVTEWFILIGMQMLEKTLTLLHNNQNVKRLKGYIASTIVTIPPGTSI